MTRGGWNDLPAGNHADITSTIAGEHTTVSVKVTRKLPDRDGPEIQSLRWEEKATPFVSAFTPANPPAHRTWSLVTQTVECLQKTAGGERGGLACHHTGGWSADRRPGGSVGEVEGIRAWMDGGWPGALRLDENSGLDPRHPPCLVLQENC